MKRILYSLILLLFFIPVMAEEVIVPQNTPVSISVKRFTSSRHIPKTYELKAVLSEDLVIDNVIVATVGNPAIIHVDDFEKAKSFGRGGKLVLDGAIFYDNNNQPHRVDLHKSIKGENDFCLLRAIPFNKGNQAELLPSDKITATITSPFKYEPVVVPVTNTQQAPGSYQKGTTIQFGIVNQNK